MSFRLIAWAKNQRVGDPVAKAVLLLLAEAANAAGSCFPSHRTLSEDSEIPRRTLQRKIDLLVSLGLISIEQRQRAGDGGRSSNLYRLNASAEYIREAGEETDTPRATVAQGGAPTGDAPPAPIGGAANEPSSLTIETSEEVSPRRREIDEGFARFWASYPRKDEQRPASKRFEAIVRGRHATVDELVAAAGRYAISVHGRERDKVKLAENWLRGEGWCDGARPTTAAAAATPPGFSRTGFAGPAELRAAIVADRGEAWTASWLDPCGWDPERLQIIPRGPTARDRLRQEIGRLLRPRGVEIGEPERAPA